ncbi:uridine diphosphate-N-acetylglucosamine-binding protein YvcK [Nocardioides sp. 616]|uniref:gluconeogenesis factor YvcK family protein n=1 Tax=Nocardioides sp. 616 TaxID=2268090 RepID=UPI001966AAE1|nr:uridine diphosphate-N-acetylglucosamine-binding protein YvcK [Nocardioides sp. 616]
MTPHQASVVALGGGHGLHASLSALRRVVTDITAVVTVADDGGSSGRLRREFEVLPPGDLRMALSALCEDEEWGQTWMRVLQHRFDGDGELKGHALGNLLIVGLWELLDDPVAGLDMVGRLLGARGRVLPMSTVPLDITAEVEGSQGTTVLRGQVSVATAQGRIRSVALDPADPPACKEAVVAVQEADWVVLGPGSWFTSVIPHLLVPELREALVSRGGRLVVVLNLEAAGETGGFTPSDHLSALAATAPGLKVHAVVADPTSVSDRPALDRAVAELGGSLVVADVARGDGSSAHDPDKLGEVLHSVMGSQSGVVTGD